MARRPVLLALSGPLGQSQLRDACRQLALLLDQAEDGSVACDVGALTSADAAAIDAIARLQLTALRRGGRIRLLHVPSRLHELLSLAGLAETLGLEPLGKSEEGEEPIRVEEEAELADPPA